MVCGRDEMGEAVFPKVSSLVSFNLMDMSVSIVVTKTVWRTRFRNPKTPLPRNPEPNESVLRMSKLQS
jgi:hypothetical protein